ncbi:multidrug effflux MFS transporter [Robiginitomaculum antarcticum]|uniref:multidrug effflux MFS transporter n=1 Tax=Robiginitomaculum antarcticum TaxID=437507 RepID=UPI0009FF49E5|nr:multidrug effflux MFS transporter [Robiginitomaculum antarcticum]
MRKPVGIQHLSNAPLPMPVWEFVGMVACMIALNALAIDVMLPALGVIGEHFELQNPNHQQFILYAYIAGFGAPQLIFGPISDRFGRKGLLNICLIGYAAMGVLCMIAPSFTLLLVARFVHGVFSSGVRVIGVSIVRDLMAGRAMARIMSLVMTVFMIVPIIAPAIGQGIMTFADWHWTFGVTAIGAIGLIIWAHIRLPETLPEDHRQDLKFSRVMKSFWSVLSTRVTCGYMVASGVIFGSLFSFIAASEQIFDVVFGRGDQFALWFAIIAGALAVSNFANSKIVEAIGMRRISHTVLFVFITMSAATALTMSIVGPNLYVFLPMFCIVFGCFGMMGANFSALAMEAQGNIAGTASAVYGFFTTTVAAGFGWIVSSQFNGSVVPMMIGFVGLGLLSLFIITYTEKGKLFGIGEGKEDETVNV